MPAFWSLIDDGHAAWPRATHVSLSSHCVPGGGYALQRRLRSTAHARLRPHIASRKGPSFLRATPNAPGMRLRDQVALVHVIAGIDLKRDGSILKSIFQ